MLTGPKKRINNGGFIATLAPLIDGQEAADLAKAAGVYRDILAWLGIKPQLDGFDGCDQAQLLLKWRQDGEPDVKLMREWTDEIWSAITDLAHGKLP